MVQFGRDSLERMRLLLAFLLAFHLFHSSHAPAVFRTRIDTTVGSFVIETHREWSPNGADRFYELVREHYYDDSRFFRVVPGRWVQFGIAGDPKVALAWRHKTIPDDTLKVHNLPGYIAFSNTGPGTRSTQVYINLRDNSALNDSQPAFAPFGKSLKVGMLWRSSMAATANTREAACAPDIKTRYSRAATHIWIKSFPN